MSIVIAGTSCLAFVLAGLVRERSEMLFRLLNHMGAGISLGMALISLPLEAGIAFGAANDAVFNGFVTSLAFVFMIVVENVAAIGGLGELFLSSYSYRPVSISDADDDDECEESGLLSLTELPTAEYASDDEEEVVDEKDQFEDDPEHQSIELTSSSHGLNSP